MSANFTRWIVFMVFWITHDVTKSEIIKGYLSPDATHHRIIIVVPTEVRHVSHIHHYPLKGHKSIYSPRYIYYRIPVGSPGPYIKCTGEAKHPGQVKPILATGYSYPTTPGPKVNYYNDNKNVVDYSQDQSEGEGPPPTSQEDKGYYDDNYSDPEPGPAPGLGPGGPPIYDGPGYNDPRPTDPPLPPPPYRKELSRYSYNGHGGAGSGGFPATGPVNNFRAEKYFQDFDKFDIRPNHDKPIQSSNHGFKTSDNSGVDFNDLKDFDNSYKQTDKPKVPLPMTSGRLPSDFPYQFNDEKFPHSPIKDGFGPLPNVDTPQGTSYFGGEDNGIFNSHPHFEGKNNGGFDTHSSSEKGEGAPNTHEVPAHVYSSPVYEDKTEYENDAKGEVYDYINTEVGPTKFNDNYRYVHESQELKAQLGLTSQEAEDFPSAEFPSNPPRPEEVTVPPTGPSAAPFYASQPDPTPHLLNDYQPITPAPDFPIFKTNTPSPKKNVKYVAYINGPLSEPSAAPPKRNKIDVKIEKQHLIPLAPMVVTSDEFFRSPLKPYDKVIGHGRAMYSKNSDYKFDTQISQRYVVPSEPSRLQSKMMVKQMPPDNGSVTARPSDPVNLKDQIHQIHGYVPKE